MSQISTNCQEAGHFLVQHPEMIGIMGAAVIALAGWLVAAKLARSLQRKQLAVQLIFGMRENTGLMDSIQCVFEKFYADRSFDWGAFAHRAYGKGEFTDDDERAFKRHVIQVLNHLEGVAIAVLNRAVDEDVLKWSQRLMVNTVHKNISPFIIETRRQIDNPNAWCNLDKLAERWGRKSDGARSGIWSNP